jgi:DNA-directed RNA polymerase specialized sigma24 family protein
MFVYKNAIVNMNMEIVGPNENELVDFLYEKTIKTIKEELEEPYRTVMIEREIKNKQLSDIADKLDWNLSTVKTRLRKARKDVEVIMKAKYPSLIESFIEMEA